MENREKLTLRRKIFKHLEPWSSEDKTSLFVDGLVTAVILINVAALTVETLPDLPEFSYTYLWYVEIFSIVFFTVEYILRIWVAPENKSFSGFLYPRLRYLITPFAIIDLLAILPFYIMVVFSVNVKVLLILRLFRLLKLVRYFKALRLMVNVFRAKSQELMIAVFFTLSILLFISFLMHYVEGPHQPDVFGSVPETLWWGIITLTTVGYGDVVPVTALGKFFGGCIAILGIGIFALPAGILASGFSDELEKMTSSEEEEEKEQMLHCPHCGKSITEEHIHQND
jgi:voltage-gated potassium channel